MTVTAVSHEGATSRLRIDAAATTQKIASALREQVTLQLKRRGLIIAMSGGVDSSVCAGLAVRALGPSRVFGLMLPERDSDPESLQLAVTWAEQLGINFAVEDISPALEGLGCYRRRNDAIRTVVPEFGPDWKCKIVLPGQRLDSDRLNVFQLAVQRPEGGAVSYVRLTAEAYRQIVAATNFKQRTRKMIEYYHADRLHYAVIGTPNRLEYDQGFFVKGGDGLADVKPIAHLYKTQVYQLAAYLGVPPRITDRPPTTDTYSLSQTQEEFYFSLPATTMDLVLQAHNEDLTVEEAAEQLGFTIEQVRRGYREIAQKRATTRYLHLPAQLVEHVLDVTTPLETR